MNTSSPLPAPSIPPPFASAAVVVEGRSPEAAPAACRHCGTKTEVGAGPFCCVGCEAVYGLLHAQDLGRRYYELRGAAGVPVSLPRADHKWIEPVEARIRSALSPIRVDLDVQGIHCSACIWLLEELFQRSAGAMTIIVNPALGRIQLFADARFSLRQYAEEIERFGYVLGPAIKGAAAASSKLVGRMGVCIAIAMNSMIFAVAIYAGLEDAALLHLFHTLNLALALASVAIGGSVFIASAWRGLRRGILHLDTPIALGIILAFSSSLCSYLQRQSGAAYFDTLTVFIALMLVGRWLQERVVERNRRFLLASDDAHGLLTRRIEAGEVKLVRCGDIAKGDRLLVAPGDLVPVDALLEDESATCSLDWINGESHPSELARGATVPAGAFAAGTRALTVVALTDFEESALVNLLRAPMRRERDAVRATPFWQRFTKAYVASVLVAAAASIPLWILISGDVGRALDVAAAVLIVTCPCALGIATPLAYDLVQAGLRRGGLFVRAAGFLDRAVSVRKVVFDKTGTLTTGALMLETDAPLDALAPSDRGVLYNLVARSTHPKSAALKAKLDGRGIALLAAINVDEIAGRGLEATHEGTTYRLGRASWALAAGDADGARDVVFSRNGCELAAFAFREQERPGCAREVQALLADGYDVHILSGDAQARVETVAATLGLPVSHAIGDRTPATKGEWLTAHDRSDTLMVGDGINDSLAAESAFCSGTPAIDCPFMAARSDFYFVTAGLAPIRLALHAAAALRRVVRRNLAVAVLYNVGTVTLAYLGLMSPLLCAVVMPVTSLTIVLSTVASLAKEPAVDVLILQIFVSLLLGAGSLVLYGFTCRQRDFEHADRLALLPTQDEHPESPAPDATPNRPSSPESR